MNFMHHTKTAVKKINYSYIKRCSRLQLFHGRLKISNEIMPISSEDKSIKIPSISKRKYYYLPSIAIPVPTFDENRSLSFSKAKLSRGDFQWFPNGIQIIFYNFRSMRENSTEKNYHYAFRER